LSGAYCAAVTTSVYVHFPWCLQKCPYCDFASGAIKRPDVPHRAYADAVLAELERRGPMLADQTLASVFFGGGTPSLWEPAQLGRVLAAIRAAFGSHAEELEITVECNPSSLDRDRARALRDAGVTRLSIGVQALDDQRLRFLGRLHDADLALRALEGAMREMPRVNADLIFGLPDQPPQHAIDDALRLARLGLSHLSIYSLTIEPGTQFGALHEKGRLPIAREDDVAISFIGIGEALAPLGFTHYEVSNYAKPGEQSRHNQHYWRGGAYLGLGAGAVGCLHQQPGSSRRYRNDPKPEQYLARSYAPEIEVFEEQLGAQEIVREHLMLGLRTAEGVDLASARDRAGVDPLHGRQRAFDRLHGRGDVVIENGVLRVPHERWLHLDSIVTALF
jgi:putative oxygen-independent coproporphyrinogen III oxidase